MKKLVAGAKHSGERLDLFLDAKLPDLSRSTIQKLIESGQVLVNGMVSRNSHKLGSSDKIQIDTTKLKKPSSQDLSLPIIYQDDDVIVINKPEGILSHSKGAFNPEATVATFIEQYTSLTGDRGGIVHRLDRGTSGVMICARNQEALAWLQKQFSTRKVKKTYFAVVKGNLDPRSAIIDMPIERSPANPKTFHVASQGKPAITKYKVLKSTGKISLLELQPQTGRTHQLRVHLAKIKHPIIGDLFYGGQKADRLYLHAQDLEITLPNKKREIFHAILPEEFNKIMNDHD